MTNMTKISPRAGRDRETLIISISLITLQLTPPRQRYNCIVARRNCPVIEMIEIPPRGDCTRKCQDATFHVRLPQFQLFQRNQSRFSTYFTGTTMHIQCASSFACCKSAYTKVVLISSRQGDRSRMGELATLNATACLRDYRAEKDRATHDRERDHSRLSRYCYRAGARHVLRRDRDVSLRFASLRGAAAAVVAAAHPVEARTTTYLRDSNEFYSGRPSVRKSILTG